MNSNKTKYSGSCLCGGIRYEITEFEPLIGHCHCHMCQKFHGAAFSTFAEVKLDNLTWTCGYKNLQSYTATNGTLRQFCKICGSSMLFRSKFNQNSNTLELAIATLDPGCAQDLQPDAHIYMSSAVSWLNVDDDLPKYAEYREPKK